VSQGLSTADLSFDEQGLPYSSRYGDHYFSRQNGLAESRYVFLQGNNLPQRWQSQPQFVIGETGFGTGLNLLATWQCWQNQPGLCCRLHYVSVEKHPLARDQLQQALALWPELAPYAQALIAAYPEAVPGFHRLHLSDGLTLTLLLGDVREQLEHLQARIDAWYLDGFAPARNPAMWQPEVLRLIAQNSAPGATLSTFTAAGSVRRSLLAAGFAVNKRPGFGAKREMLQAVLSNPPPHPVLKKPWLSLPKPFIGERRAIVIGAGLAGSAVAHALARRSWQVTVLDRESGPAQQASGNPAGLVMPRLSAVLEPGNEFYLHGFLYLLRELARHPDLRWLPCGVVQCAADERERDRLQRALQAYGLPASVAQYLDAAQISERAGVTLSQDGVWFPGGGCLQPRSLCQLCLQQAGITTHYCTDALCIAHAESNWQVFDHSGLIHQTPVLIIAAGLASPRFEPVSRLPLWAYRGQTSTLTPTLKALRVALCGPVYITPEIKGEQVIGATFQAYDRDCSLRSADDQENLHHLRHWLPQLIPTDAQAQGLFAQLRATTPGRLPAVGPAPDATMFDAEYAALFRHGKPARYYPPLHHHAGLYTLTGLGSRGIVSAPLAAEYLASLIDGEPLPLPRRVIDALNPARFLLRQLK